MAPVYGVVLVVLAVVVGPYVVISMRKSDNTYDDIETDDPVAHTEQLYRRELRDEQLRDRVKLLVGDGDEDDGDRKSVV